MNDIEPQGEAPSQFNVLSVFAGLAEPLAPHIARIEAGLIAAEPIADPETHPAHHREAIREAGSRILAESGVEGLCFAVALIASHFPEREEDYVAFVQRSWAGLPHWGPRTVASSAW